MTTIISKSLLDEYPGGFEGSLNTTQFSKEISESSIIPTCFTVLNIGLTVEIVFSAPLSNDELAVLDSLVLNHTPKSIDNYSNIISVTPTVERFKGTDWTVIKSWVYEGSDSIGDIKKIVAIGSMDTDITSFSIKIIDSTNNNTITQNTFTSVIDNSILEFTNITNIPSSRSVLEILVKNTGGNKKKYSYINDITFYI